MLIYETTMNSKEYMPYCQSFLDILRVKSCIQNDQEFCSSKFISGSRARIGERAGIPPFVLPGLTRYPVNKTTPYKEFCLLDSRCHGNPECPGLYMTYAMCDLIPFSPQIVESAFIQYFCRIIGVLQNRVESILEKLLPTRFLQ